MTTTGTTRAAFRFESLTGFFLAHPTQQEDPNYAVASPRILFPTRPGA